MYRVVLIYILDDPFGHFKGISQTSDYEGCASNCLSVDVFSIELHVRLTNHANFTIRD